MQYCILTKNSAQSGGAVGFSIFYAYLNDANNVYSANTAVLSGGAVYIPCWACLLVRRAGLGRLSCPEASLMWET